MAKQMTDTLFSDQKKEYNEPTTKSGYSLSLVVSALQKTIRRGMEIEAGYFALELIESGYINYLMNRLVVIAHEDVGDQKIELHAMLLRDYIFNYKKEKKKTPDSNIVTRLILDMCRAEKDREGDDFKVFVEEKRREGWKPKIEEYMADFHTSEGKARNPGMTKEAKVKLWKEELTKVNKEKPGNKYKGWKTW